MRTALFSQSHSDMHWRLYDLDDGYIRWAGYDDSNWWEDVSKTDHFRNRVGPTSGRTYTLNPINNMVTTHD